MKRVFSCVGILGFLLAIPLSASADTNVTVLGLRSVEGDDDFALSLTGALRHAAAQVRGWRVSDNEVSLAQMSLAHGCDEPDAACMQDIAETLDAERVIYGTVGRTSAGADYDYAITLYSFNAETGQIEGSLTDTILRVRSDIDFLRERVEGYIALLTGAEQRGTLRIVGNVPGADIYVDGERVGTADADGEFTMEVAAGRRRVEVSAEGYTSFRGSVTVVPGSESEIEVNLTEGGGGIGPGGPVNEGPGINWAGWGLVGLGAAAAGATIYSWLRLQSLNEGNDITADDCRGADAPDPDTFPGFRCVVPRSVENVCDEVRPGGNTYGNPQGYAAAGEVCREAGALEILQYVFLGTAIAAGAGGAFLLATDSDEDEDPNATSLGVTPIVNRDGGRVTATLRF